MVNILLIAALVVAVILVVCVYVSNCAFISTIVRNECFRNVRYILMCNLAFSNNVLITMVIVTIGLKSGLGYSNENVYVCVFASSCIWLSVLVYISTNFLLSLDQLLAIKVPLWHHKIMKAPGVGVTLVKYEWLIVIIGWVAFHLATNPLDVWMCRPTEKHGCEHKLKYFVLFLVVLAIVVTGFIGYAKIYFLYVSHKQQTKPLATPVAKRRLNMATSQKYVDALEMSQARINKASNNIWRFLLIYISFIVVNLPGMILVTIDNMFPNIAHKEFETITMWFSIFRTIKIILDPMLFSYKDPKLRQTFYSCFICCKYKTNASPTTSFDNLALN